jgi:flagellar basal-body rod modification protein FlgD
MTTLIAANGPNTATSGAATTASGATRQTGLGADFNTFLRLLTTQLQNQDPTNAMSPEQMTAQLVQFAGVEQQIRVNSSLEKLIGLQQASQLTASAPLLGQMVEIEGNQLALQGGAARLRLPPAGLAAAATIQVLDPSGRTLREARVPLGQDVTEWNWDGRDAAGRRMPDGAYRFSVTGTNSAGGTVPVTATSVARATGTERVEGDLRLMFGALGVGFDAVRSLRGAGG